MRGLIVSVLLVISAASPETARCAEPGDDLGRRVVIRRTTFGVPHILGETEKAAAYGLAWSQCEDHFPIVYKSMVRGRSELSRCYGGSEQNLKSDFDVLHLRARKTVVDNYHRLPSDYRDVLSGFAAGLNAYMRRHPEETADWMTPVTPHDVATAWKVAVMRFTFLRRDVMGRLRKEVMQETAALPNWQEKPMPAIGSNTIALAPSRTVSGHAMLLNNPHQPWSEEANYYEAHLTVPGVYNFYGSTFAGSPVLTTGFNRQLGWSHTVNQPQLYQLYRVELDPDRPGHYQFDESSVPLESADVTIQVKGKEPLTRELIWSPLGPVIHQNDRYAFILRSAAYEQYLSGAQWYRMGKSQSLQEFREALQFQQIPMFNIAYADRDGNIMYLWNATPPVFPHPVQPRSAVPATRSDEIWTKIHPLADLMQLVNPQGGYVQNCNSPPYLTNLQAPLDRRQFPDSFPVNDLSLRTQQALLGVENERKFRLEDLAELKFSTRLLLADRVKNDLIRVLEKAPLNEEEQQAIEMLRVWDNTAAAKSVGSVLFTTWWRRYRKGNELFEVSWNEAEPMATPRGIGSPERAVAAFRRSMAEVKERWGSWRVSWGDVHRLRVGKVDLPVGGADGIFGCLRVCDYRKGEDGRLEMSGGDGFIFLVEFGELPKAYSILAYGQGRHNAGEVQDKQARMFAGHQLKPVAFTEEDISRQLLEEYRPGEKK